MTTRFLRRLLLDERGATAIEYGLIAALIFIAALSAMTLMGANFGVMIDRALSAINSAIS